MVALKSLSSLIKHHQRYNWKTWITWFLAKKIFFHQIQHSNQLNPLEANLEYLLKKGILITDPAIQFTPGMNFASFFPCEQQMKALSLSVAYKFNHLIVFVEISSTLYINKFVDVRTCYLSVAIIFHVNYLRMGSFPQCARREKGGEFAINCKYSLSYFSNDKSSSLLSYFEGDLKLKRTCFTRITVWIKGPIFVSSRTSLRARLTVCLIISFYTEYQKDCESFSFWSLWIFCHFL